MREQAVTAAEIDDAPAAEDPPRALGDFPRFVKFLARKRVGQTHRAAETIEQPVTRESAKVVTGKPISRRR